jgi:hypothetical protein
MKVLMHTLAATCEELRARTGIAPLACMHSRRSYAGGGEKSPAVQVRSEYLTNSTEYYTEGHLHCFLRKRYSS